MWGRGTGTVAVSDDVAVFSVLAEPLMVGVTDGDGVGRVSDVVSVGNSDNDCEGAGDKVAVDSSDGDFDSVPFDPLLDALAVPPSVYEGLKDREAADSDTDRDRVLVAVGGGVMVRDPLLDPDKVVDSDRLTVLLME